MDVTRDAAYGRVVIARLLLLAALLLMPFGMAPAAAATFHHDMGAAMPTGHCPDGPSKHHVNGGIAKCTMVCSASLPAVAPVEPELLSAQPPPARPMTGQRLHGLHLETATPPPKRA